EGETGEIVMTTLQRQATPLTPQQQAQIDSHPDTACEALKKIGVADALWLNAVAQHHEKPGGKGYPRQLDQPAEEAQLLRLIDTFFGRASIRADRHPLAPAQIIRALFVDDGQGPFAALVASLVKFLGIYPPGSFVKLANGETGVVFRAGENANAPIVASVTTASGIPAMQPVRRDTSREAFAVSATVAPDKVSVGYDLGKLWVTNAK
ncbi:MAG TPA: HD domain-containing phosphohydrolase, partial [Rhodocyclaceae bacterium]|nr:HD domain-containing phosphohydrolase [Rhodocyclaceae bacterium]